MSGNDRDLPENSRRSNRLGLFMALAFYVVSVVMVSVNVGDGSITDIGVKTITIAHWQLEDGFRQGVDMAIREYENLKASQGEKVKIIQSTVPGRGYPQWFVTQLISGDPSDVIEMRCSSQMMAQYFVPLSEYVSEVNPYNRGTPLAGMPWKDTYVDGMQSGLNGTYAEYFGVGFFFHVMRVYVNKELVKKATGSDKMPVTFDEWTECCRKLREYGERIGRPIIPIGISGFGKGMLFGLFKQYFSQLNGNLVDTATLFCQPGADSMLSRLAAVEPDMDRLLAAVDLVQELGRNFSDGFVTADEEQMKFLFFSGNVGFYVQGTHDAWSLINNSPFEVEVINLPAIGPDNRYYKYFTGRTSELGVGVGGSFGIAKATRHFDLALDFLRFLTSYRINHMMMMDYCKWPPAVVKAKYEGLLEKFEPIAGDARKEVYPPFSFSGKSQTKLAEVLDRIVVDKVPDPKKYFWEQFIANLPYMIEENRNAQDDAGRRYFDLAGQCSCTSAGLLAEGLTVKRREMLEFRNAVGLENMVSRIAEEYLLTENIEAMEKLQRRDGDGGRDGIRWLSK